jgi:hypothetical protein
MRFASIIISNIHSSTTNKKLENMRFAGLMESDASNSNFDISIFFLKEKGMNQEASQL